MKPEQLGSFAGWRPLDSGEKIQSGDVFVAWRGFYNSLDLDPNKRTPLPVGDPRSSQTQDQLLTRGSVNTDFWPYRRVTYELMPEGIVPDPGWFPLADNEPIRNGDKWYYQPKWFSTPQEASEETIGKTPLFYKDQLGIKVYAGWPYRYGQNFGSPATEGAKKRRLPENVHYSKVLPLP